MKKNKMEYRLPEIKDVEIEDIPTFYKSAGGNPYVTRMGSGIDASSNVFKTIEVDEFKYLSTSTSELITRTHNLGVKPYIFGTYKMTNMTVGIGSAPPDLLRGSIPEDRKGDDFGTGIFHDLSVSFVDKNTYILSVSTSAVTSTIDFRLFLLRELAA